MPDPYAGDTLFDHAAEPAAREEPRVEPSPACKALAPGCGCGHRRCHPRQDPPHTVCTFATWVVDVARELARSAPEDRHLPEKDRGLDLDPDSNPLGYLLSKKALGSHYPGERVALPGFYAFHDNPLDQGVRMISVLYSRAHDPEGTLPIDHRAGYRAEPGVCRIERFFSAGFVEQGQNAARLVDCANHIDIRELVCRTQEDLENLYRSILETRLPEHPDGTPRPTPKKEDQ